MALLELCRRRNGDNLDICHYSGYSQRIEARSVKDAFREGIPEVGASAVPAGGVTNRSRAASGIS